MLAHFLEKFIELFNAEVVKQRRIGRDILLAGIPEQQRALESYLGCRRSIRFRLARACPRPRPKAYRSGSRDYFRRRDRFTSVALRI